MRNTYRYFGAITVAAAMFASGLPATCVAAEGRGSQTGATPRQVACPIQPNADDLAGMAKMRDAMLTPGIKPDFSALMNSPQAKAYLDRAEERQRNDWGDLCYYRTANVQQRSLGRPQIVFMGDSITENWAAADPALFTGAVVGRGISGQTSSQMLLRFYADVIALQPQMVHILAGTNDIALNSGIISDDAYKNNIKAMVDLAQANHIGVILASIPPSDAISWVPDLKPAARIAALNKWLQEYAQKRGIRYVNYYAVLNDGHGGLLSTLGNDGVHPNRLGYVAMIGTLREILPKLAKQALVKSASDRENR